MVCFEYHAQEANEKDSDGFKTWWQKHERICLVNHARASGEMESKGEIRMLLRSIEKRNLKYLTMVGDGDTGCYGHVCDALQSENGESYVVAKEECVVMFRKGLVPALVN